MRVGLMSVREAVKAINFPSNTPHFCEQKGVFRMANRTSRAKKICVLVNLMACLRVSLNVATIVEIISR